jgi:four helix bundle protein
VHYRELVVWQKAMQMAKAVYQIAPKLPKEETYAMRSQLTRAAASIPANIAEGWARESEREKAQFLSIAQGSLAETETFLTLCNELGWIQPEESEKAQALLTEVGKMLTAMRRTYRDKR